MFSANRLFARIISLNSQTTMEPTATPKNGRTQRVHNSLATILAIGTANPPNVMYQDEFPHFYFSATNSDHNTDLNNKFKTICEGSMTKKRHLVLTEETIRTHPELWDPNVTSLNTRLDILSTEIPNMGKAAAVKAIEEWGQPKSKISHLIFCTSSGVDLPGADFRLVKLLGLNPSVKRFMLYQQGCHGGGTVLRLAKDVAENNPGARVLVVCSESSAVCFHGPTASHVASVVGAAIFGDGAAALIIGTADGSHIENPLFEIVKATQATLPDSEDAVAGPLREMGMELTLRKDIAELISKEIERVLEEAIAEFGVMEKQEDWNAFFWAVHPGGRAIVDLVEAKLGLREEKLEATRRVMSEFGNMFSASVVFVLDEVRKKSAMEGKTTTGEGLEWGLLLGLGPGVTVETVLLRSVPESMLNFTPHLICFRSTFIFS